MKQILKRLYDSKPLFGFSIIILSILLAVFFAAFFFLLTPEKSWESFCSIFEISYIWFCAPYSVGGIFIILSLFKEDEIRFALGVYYGGLAISNIIKGISLSETYSYLLGYVITILICYIIFLKMKLSKLEKQYAHLQDNHM